MNQKKTFLLINPISGTKKKDGLIDAMVSRLTKAGHEVTVAKTERAGHARELTKQAIADGYGSILVCGGDGTINEAASAMVGSSVALGILPSGSGNGLARHIEVPIDELMAMDVITDGVIVDCDCGQVVSCDEEGHEVTRNFFCTCGIGFDAYVAHMFAKAKKRGMMEYVRAVFNAFGSYKSENYALTIGEERTEMSALILACCNASQYGNNVYISPSSSIRDGQLEFVTVKDVNTLRKIISGLSIIMGNATKNANIETVHADAAVIELEAPAYGHIDGEPLMFYKFLKINCLPACLKMYVPTKHRGITPFVTPFSSAFRNIGISLGHIFKKHKTESVPPKNDDKK